MKKLDFKLFIEMFGMFSYIVPKDKQQQMYDFSIIYYVISSGVG